MIVAPIISGTSERDVWLPSGEWFDFFTGEKFCGGVHHRAVSHIPVYVKGGTLLPVAEPVNYIERDTVFDITLRAYGEVSDDAFCTLIEDSDDSYDALYTVHKLNKNTLGKVCERYNVVGFEEIK